MSHELRGASVSHKYYYITPALETSQIKLPLPSAREEGGVKGGGGQVVTWELTCAVWAFSVPGGPGSRNIHVR